MALGYQGNIWWYHEDDVGVKAQKAGCRKSRYYLAERADRCTGY